MNNIIILGGGYAGTMAAVRLAGKTKKHNVNITLVNASDTFVERIRLHQAASNQNLKTYSFEKLLRGTGVKFVQGWVSAIDLENQMVRLADGRTLSYDTLAYTLGSTIDAFSVPGAADYAYSLRPHGERSVKALQERLPQVATQGGHVIVCGGGLTGIESASEFAESYPGLRVTLITRDAVGEGLSKKGRAHVLKVFSQLGVTVKQAVIRAVEPDHIVLENGETVPFDACLWLAGFKAHALASDAGLAVNDKGQILVDAHLRSTSHPEVYAAGDSAAPMHMPMSMDCQSAMPMAGQMADNIAAAVKGKPQKPFDYAYVGRCISLGRRNGLLQRVSADATSLEKVYTGRPIAWVKELIVRSTIWVINLERRFPGSYYWLKRGKTAQQQSMQESKGYGTV